MEILARILGCFTRARRARGSREMPGWLVVLMVIAAGWIAGTPVSRGEEPHSEYEIKALFLFNFVKYVDWPPAAFAETNSPVVIGLFGEDKFGGALNNVVKGKSIAGREIVVQSIDKTGDPGNCHILFISDSEKKRLDEILDKVKRRPVLTVGETARFMEAGGVINFVKKESKVRLEINLDAARRAGLQISSKLLNVADVVKGKPK